MSCLLKKERTPDAVLYNQIKIQQKIMSTPQSGRGEKPAPPPGSRPYARTGHAGGLPNVTMGQPILSISLENALQKAEFQNIQSEKEIQEAKAKIEEEVSSQEIHSPHKSLLQFDIRCDSLQYFLQEITNTVNEHTKKIAILEAEMRLRSSDIKIGQVLHGLADYLPDRMILNADENLRRNVKNRSLSSLGGVTGAAAVRQGHPDERENLTARAGMPSGLDSRQHSRQSILNRILGTPGTSGEFQDLATKADTFGEKMKLFGEAVAKVLRESAGMKEKMNELELDIAGRMGWKEAKDKLKRRKEKFHALVRSAQPQVDEKVGGVEAKVDSQQKTLNQKMLELDQKMHDLKEKTLWKLEDCNELLKNRVNQEFVYEVSRNVEDRLLKEWKSKHKTGEDLKKEVFEQMKREALDRNKEFDDRLSGLYDNYLAVFKKVESGPDAKDFQQLQLELDDLKLKCDSEFKESNKIHKRHEELLRKILREIDDEINPDNPNFGQRRNKMEQIINELAYLKEKYSEIGPNVGERLNNAEIRLHNLEAENQLKPERDQINGFAFKSQNGRDLAKDFNLLHTELDRKMREIEQKLKQKGSGNGITEGSDLHRKLLKMINEKASIDDVGQHILSHDLKLKNHDDVLRQMANDLEDFAKTIKNILTALSNNSPGQYNNILISAKGLHCLSCGRDQTGKVMFSNVCGHSPYQHGRRYKINRSMLLDDANDSHALENSGSTSAFTLRKNPSQVSLKRRISSARSTTPKPHLRSNSQYLGSGRVIAQELSKTEGFQKEEGFNQTTTTLPGSISSPQLLTERKATTEQDYPPFVHKVNLSEVEKTYLKETSQISARGIGVSKKGQILNPQVTDKLEPVYRSDRSRSITPTRKPRPTSGTTK